MAAQSQTARKILMLGKSGVGKSATGNSLLGRKVFESKAGQSVTKACQEATVTRDGVQITVIDTPGICDTHGLDAATVIDDYITSTKCELHAICLVLGTSRPTPEEIQVVVDLSKKLGEAMLQYLFIVITSAKNLDRDGVKPKDFLKGFVTPETDILDTCIQNDRVLGIDNFKDEKKKQQIPELLKTVNTMVSENKGAMYTHRNLEQNKKKLEEEERRLKEEKEKMQRQKEEQHKREMELERNKGKEEERQVVQKERDTLKKHEEELKKREKRFDESVRQHNDNAERMGMLEQITKRVKTGGTATRVAAVTTLVALPFAGPAAPLIGLAAGVAAGASIDELPDIAKLFTVSF